MGTQQIYYELTELFKDIFGADTVPLHPELTADDIASWDSFTHLSLLVAIETRFQIKFATQEIDALSTVGDLVQTISRKSGRAT